MTNEHLSVVSNGGGGGGGANNGASLHPFKLDNLQNFPPVNRSHSVTNDSDLLKVEIEATSLVRRTS